MTHDWSRSAPSFDEIHEAMAAVFPELAGPEQQAGAALYRLVAGGEPVLPAALGEKLGWKPGEARRYLVEGDLRSQVEWDGPARNRVVGFGGLTTRHSRHSLLVDGRRLSTWCAWDGLCMPEILGVPATVESVCPGVLL